LYRELALVTVLGLLGMAFLFYVSQPAHGLPNPPDPINSGPHNVAYYQVPLVDTRPGQSNRPVLLDVWYPTSATTGGPAVLDLRTTTLNMPGTFDSRSPLKPGNWPLLVFSHGLGVFGPQSYDLMRHIASYGWIVAAPTHSGNSIYEIAAGKPLDSFPDTIVKRTADVSFTIGLLSDLYGPHLDETRIAVMGHSAGGWTALAAAADPRVDAVVAMGPFVLPALMPDQQIAAIDIPVMVIGGKLDQTTPPSYYSQRVWDNLPGTDKYRIDIELAVHASPSNVCDIDHALRSAPIPTFPSVQTFVGFLAADACNPNVTIDPKYVTLFTAGYAVPFLESYVKGDHTFSKWLTRTRVNRFPVDYWRCSAGTCDVAPS
jgi:predicted dienelactone hydrolase